MSLNKENILIVDDDVHILELIQRHLQALNYHTFKAISVKEATAILKDSAIDLLITDLKMPEVDGFQLIKYVAENYPQLPRLVVTGYPSGLEDLKIIGSGKVDYLVKPFTREELKQAVLKAFAQVPKPESPQKSGAAAATDFSDVNGITGNSEKIKKIKDIISRVKDNKATIFISGESGTGKELVARAVHYSGKFAREPFIAVNCGAIPENLLEAELFGYSKGAFTGAAENRSGFFQAANNGTIFLDEIGNASAAVQSGLLRVLQEKEIMRVGTQKPEAVNIRIIAATNGDLTELIKENRFREDLYYRLTVVEIAVPPLRERKEDIPLLTEIFLQKYGLEYRNDKIQIDPTAMEMLLRYDWPGNIRELENVIQRAIIMSDGFIGIEGLPDGLKYKIDFPPERLKSLEEMEKEYIQKVLTATGNNKTKAAEILQIDRKTLRQKIQ